MGLKKNPKGGQGGKRGHSNMSHWTGTEEIKIAHNKYTRRESKNLTKDIDK